MLAYDNPPRTILIFRLLPAAVMLKLKLMYTISGTGEAVTEVVDVKAFPATL